MNNFSAGWYLIYTKPRHEKKVHSKLTEMNVDSLLPLTKTLRTWHDRKKFIMEPVFPSYVFIQLQNLKDYYAGTNTEGFLYYVRNGKNLARINEPVVNNIRLISKQKNEIEVSSSRFRPGQKLVINHGALTGLSCEVVDLDFRRKLLVRVDLLQRNILIPFPEDYLLAI